MSKENFKKEFGLRIKFFRDKIGLNQFDLGTLIGRSTEGVSNMERGIHFPKPEILELLAETFKISVADLFDFPIIKNQKEHTRAKTILVKELVSLTYKLDEKSISYIINQAKGLKDLK